MKYLAKTLLFLFFFTNLSAQTYPFQNNKLTDEERLGNLLSLMTLEEKIHCLSTRPSIPRLGVRGTRIVEGLHGLALSGPANWAVKGKGESPTTIFPQAIGLAQTWNPALLQKIADHEATEARFLSQHPDYMSAGLVVLAPNADLGRDIRWGRTEECFGEDPFLVTKLSNSIIRGLQGDHPKYWKTASMMKHFLANSNENNRYLNSSNFDERLFREYYAYPFYKGITEANAGAYMAAYNQYKNIPMAVHPVLKNVTVNEWKHKGIIATDGGAYQRLVKDYKLFDEDLEKAAAACIKAGITMFLDDYKSYLKGAVEKNYVTEKEIEEVLKKTLWVYLKIGLFDDSSDNPYLKIGTQNETFPWETQAAKDLVRQATTESIVLLKNDNKTLPLTKEKIKTIAVIGPVANEVISDWYAGTPPYSISALQGIKNALGENVEVRFAATNKADSAVIAAKGADVVIVCIGNHPLSHGMKWGKNLIASDGREDVDRQAISTEQEDLVKLVKAANPNVVLAVISSFPYDLSWSKANIPAIVHISQSSQELGNGLADVLFGKVNPAGRLVQTWSSSIEHLMPILEYDITKGKTYMYNKHEPLYAFGHGLSYTNFAYSNLKMSSNSLTNKEKVTVSFDVKNTGNMDGDEVAQLYVSFPNSKVKRPNIALKGFQRAFIPRGKTLRFELELNAEDLMYWNVDKNAFELEKGKIDFFIGTSSVTPKLKGSLVAK